MDGRRLQRVAVLAILVTAVGLAGFVGAGRPAQGAATDRFANMPAPEAFLAPTPSAANAQTSDATSITVYRATVRLKRGSYSLQRFDSTGAVVARRTASLAYTRVYYARPNERSFGGANYVKLTSGPWDGWWVPAPTTSAFSSVSGTTSYTLNVAPGNIVGKRFFGPVTLRRSGWLSTAATYHSKQRATFNGTLHYLLADGPLAGRWVSAGRVTVAASGGSGSPTSTPSPAPVVTPTVAPTASPTTKPTAAPASTWKAVALIYRQTDVTFKRSDGTSYRLQSRMSDAMYDLVRNTLGRTVTTVGNWSGGLAAMNLTFVDVPTPLSKVDPLGSAYWVSPQSVEADMDRYAPTGTYDSVFVVFHPRDAAGVEIPIGGWGLTIPGGSWSNNAGFTSVMTPAAMWWWTESAVPEEVFIHEWLHQVIFFHQDAGRLSLDLHAGRDYGYDDPNGTWKAWYSDIMQGKVRDGDRYIGLTAKIWAAGKPTAP